MGVAKKDRQSPGRYAAYVSMFATCVLQHGFLGPPRLLDPPPCSCCSDSGCGLTFNLIQALSQLFIFIVSLYGFDDHVVYVFISVAAATAVNVLRVHFLP